MFIRSRAPLRLGLAGGGTDVEPYSSMYGGHVLNATIDLHVHVTLEPLADTTVTFHATDVGRSYSGRATYPLPTDGPLGLHCAAYNRVVRQFNHERPLSLRLTTYADAPPGSGLGSSSTLVVAIVKAFQEYLALPLGEYDVARLAYEIERNDMELSGGKQDQYAATFGGFNFMEFYSDNRVIVNPLRVKNWIISELEASTLLYFTGVSRESAHIIDEQRKHMIARTPHTMNALHELKHGAERMKEAVLKGDFSSIAAAMRASWVEKKKTAAMVSNSEIDAIVDAALSVGARAAKVSGAGGGGFVMFLVDPVRRLEVQNVLNKYGGQVRHCHFTKTGTEGWRVNSERDD